MLLLLAAATAISGSTNLTPVPTPVQDSAKPDPGSAEIATGSPSNATATVSPVTAAAAVEPTRATSSVELSLGTSLATGDFGSSSSTSLWSTALGARISFGDVRLSASVPYMRIRSNAVIFTGIDSTPVVVAGGAGPKRTNDGLGDLTVGASYTLPHQPGALEIELAGRAKLATATRDSQLSSGKNDYSLGIQATKTMGQLAPFVSATYRILGDSRAFNLRDGLAASAGASLVLDRRTVLLGSYHYARAASRFVHDGHELFLGGSREIDGSRLRLTGFGTVGLSNGAAAASGGVAVSLAL